MIKNKNPPKNLFPVSEKSLIVEMPCKFMLRPIERFFQNFFSFLFTVKFLEIKIIFLLSSVE